MQSFGLGEAADTVTKGISVANTLKPEQIIQGDLSSLTAAAPDLLHLFNLEGATDAVVRLSH